MLWLPHWLPTRPIASNTILTEPVPLHWTRRWSRGYNQAECIAKTLAEELGAEMRTDILFRRRRTATQTRLSVEQKGKNVHGAFKAIAQDPAPVHVLLIDDVFTTGSTLMACFMALREAFPSSAVRISVATLGFVGRAWCFLEFCFVWRHWHCWLWVGAGQRRAWPRDYLIHCPTGNLLQRKIDTARHLHFNYNATNQQLRRLLRMDLAILEELFP